jgi:uridine kinase
MGASSIKLTNSPRLIAIMGGSGAGKTYLAAMLERHLPGQVLRLSLDNFYRDRSSCSPALWARVNFDHPRAIDWDALETALIQLAKGRPAHIPQYDFATHTRHPQPHIVQPRPIVLVEGLWPLHRARIRRLFDYSIFLACPASDRLRRRLNRDVAERGRTPASVRHQFLQTVSPMHRKYVAPQTLWSDLIVRRTLLVRDVAQLARTIQQGLVKEEKV